MVWRDYISHQAWECLCAPHEEVVEVARAEELLDLPVRIVSPAIQIQICGRKLYEIKQNQKNDQIISQENITFNRNKTVRNI